MYYFKLKLIFIGSREFSTSYYGQGWKLPDKLRIVKPLEGSLTLHQWQRLAKPSLGGIFEERKGVVQRGSRLNPAPMESLGGLEEMSDLEDEDEVRIRLKTGATRLQQTLTNSKIMHPDVTEVTSTYGRSRISSMQSSMQSSRRESICSSMDDLRMNFGTTTFSTNLGLAYVLNERNIHGGSTLSLDQSRGITCRVMFSLVNRNANLVARHLLIINNVHHMGRFFKASIIIEITEKKKKISVRSKNR